MRAVVITGPGHAEVRDVEPPVAGPGSVVIEVARVGLCGTDAEFFTGEMAYLHQGHARYPIRIGHEWCGTVTAVGDGVDPSWLGRRTTGDTMLGCGHCARCLDGRGHLCDDRAEVGIRRDRPGALAERLEMPVTALHPLPDHVDDVAGALVEPGGNALRAVRAADVGPGRRVLVLGAGTIGILAARFARSLGSEVHVVGRSARSIAFARTADVGTIWGTDGRDGSDLPALAFDAVIDASNDPALPTRALDLVEPGRRVVFIGLAGVPSHVDTRLLALKDVTAVGILSASPGLDGTIDAYASGDVDPRDVVAATVGLDDVADVLAGRRPAGAGDGPKIHVDPHR